MQSFQQAYSKDDSSAQAYRHDLMSGVTAFKGKSYQKAYAFLSAAAGMGSSIATDLLGYLYENGLGVKRNEIMALKCYMTADQYGCDASFKHFTDLLKSFGVTRVEKAAQAGNMAAQLDALQAYLLNDQLDYSKALHWAHKAAAQGSSMAKVLVGFCYLSGYGVDLDCKEAMQWYLKASAQGNSSGENNIGYVYDKQLIAEENYPATFKWYLKSANHWNAHGEGNVGYQYELGHGVPQDKSIAEKWYERALADGLEMAKDDIKSLGAEGGNDFISALEANKAGWKAVEAAPHGDISAEIQTVIQGNAAMNRPQESK